MTAPSTRTLPFFVTAWSISALALLPALLARAGWLPGPPEKYMGLALFAVFSPTIAAMLVARFERGGAGALSVFRPLRASAWRVGPIWYVVALGMVGVAFFAGMVVYRLAGGSGPLAYVPHDAQHIAAMIMVPIGEEIGWRGFALPRLNARHGRIDASLILGAGWAVWHIPMFLLQGFPLGPMFVVALLFFLPGSVLFSWLFSRTGGSLPLAILFHVGAHANNTLGSLPERAGPALVGVCTVTLLAVVLLLVDRQAFRS
jgi:uncharacterized protein